MNETSDDSGTWEPCPIGTLQAITRRSQQIRMAKRAALLAPIVMLLLLSLSISGVLSSPFHRPTTHMSCKQVVILFPEYTAKSLATSQRERVEQHLKTCPACSEKLKSHQMRNRPSIAGGIRNDHLVGFQVTSAIRDRPMMPIAKCL